jgi:hypothetical protein
VAGENIVRILVTADNEASEGFDEASASADEMAGKVSAAADEYTAAMQEAAAAQADLLEMQESGTASADELAAAQDRVTETTLASIDAQVKLGEAELQQSAAEREAAESSASASGEISEAAYAAAEANADLAAAQQRVTAASAEYKAAATEAAAAAGKLAETEAAAGADSAEYAAQLDVAAAATQRAADAQTELSAAQKDQAGAAQAATAANVEAGTQADEAGASAIGFGSKMKLAALGMVAAAAVSVKMAADWQESLTQLVTGAGEPVKAMAAIRQGILSLSVGTDTSVQDLTSGLYMISSAGYHGAEGLTVLKAAAEGAKTGNAQLADVANVLTSAMNAYHLPASAAVSVTNQLVATVAAGKMHMQDLATSLSSVLPVAASAHISFAQVGGALATMTMQGMTARRASMNLANMIRALISPSADASAEMKNLGLNANQVAQNVGREGLTGTLSTLTQAILSSSRGNSALAASFAGMAPQTKAYAEQILAGKMTTSQLTTATDGLSVTQAGLLTAFSKTASSATGVKTTFDGAMKTMVGGATGLNVALLLGGKNMKAFQGNVKSVADAAKDGGSNVSGWAKIQGDFNFKLGQAGKALEAVAYSLGDALLPVATKVMNVIAVFGEWLVKNKLAAYALAAVIIGTLATVIGGKLVSSVMEAKEAFSALADSEMLQGIASKAAAAGQWLLNAAMDANPIMLIVIAIAAVVAAIVLLTMHCKAFRDFWKDAWHDIENWAVDAGHFIEHVFDDLKHDLADAVDAIRETVVDGWKDMWRDVTTLTEDLWHDVVNFFTSLWHDLVSIAETLWHNEVTNWENIYHDVLTWVQRLFHDVVSWFGKLPGRILAAIADLPGMLLHAGEHAIDSLIDGLGSGIGKIGSVMGGIASKIAGFIGLSPAREGPLSGGGSMYVRGLHIPQDVAMGISAGLPGLASAANRMAGTVGLGPGGTRIGAAGGGALTLEVTGGGSGLDELFITWLKEKVRVKGGGGQFSVQKALGSTWPRGA